MSELTLNWSSTYFVADQLRGMNQRNLVGHQQTTQNIPSDMCFRQRHKLHPTCHSQPENNVHGTGVKDLLPAPVKRHTDDFQ